jgi:hypothetical protein
MTPQGTAQIFARFAKNLYFAAVPVMNSPGVSGLGFRFNSKGKVDDVEP